MHKKLASSRSLSKPCAASLIVPIRELNAGHRELIFNHLLLLNEDDRHLRFGTQTTNEVIERYVHHLDFDKDKVFGHFDALLRLSGVAHLAYLAEAQGQSLSAELGVSVLPEGRGHGIATALLARATVHARNTGINTLLIHCLANNKAMMHIAHKAGMHIDFAYGDADAYLKLPPANHSTILDEVSNRQWADLDYAAKDSWKRSNDAWGWLLANPLLRRT